MGVKVIRPSGRKDWYLQVCEGGQRYLRHVGSREAAYAAKKDIEEALATNTFKRPKRRKDEGITFQEAVARWKKEHVELKLKPSTIRYYGLIVDKWLLPVFGDKEVGAITRADVRAAVARWKEEKEKSPPEEKETKGRKRKAGQGVRSIPNVLRALRSFFSWAIEEEIVEVNVCAKPSRLFKVDSPFRGDFLRPEEVPPYLEGLKAKAPRYVALFRTMTFTGLRLGEALGLEWGDIDWHGKFVTVQRSSSQGRLTTPKSETSLRRVNLSPEMIEVLREHKRAIAAESLVAGRAMPERVFVNEEGNPVDESKARKAHDRALKAAGLRHIRVHDLRGTFASLLVTAGVPVFHVSKALGHKDPSTTTKHYANLAPGADREMPNVLERFVFGDSAGRDANQVRTEAENGSEAESTESASGREIKEKTGAPGEIRTPDPLLRRQLLYPPELQAREMIGL